MGGGIARQLKQEYPEVYSADLTTSRGDRSKLGSFSKVTTSAGFTVVNAYTQYRYGEDPAAKDGVLADYLAIRMAFRLVRSEFGGKGLRFGIPKIGAGLARGDWSVISKIVEEEMAGEDLTLVLFG
jgi:O-acetyl-ADP-ribose deacetylase (regulator of RNase III)